MKNAYFVRQTVRTLQIFSLLFQKKIFTIQNSLDPENIRSLSNKKFKSLINYKELLIVLLLMD